MSTRNGCPICQDPVERTPVSVTVDGVDYVVCCEDCAKQALADPSRLR